jgi:hypothetical protein
VLGNKLYIPLALIDDVQHRGHGAGFDDPPIARLAFPFDAHDD